MRRPERVCVDCVKCTEKLAALGLTRDASRLRVMRHTATTTVMAWTKLHSKLIHSSIWSESPETCKVWITMLAMADQHGLVQASRVGLARACALPLDKVEDALRVLMSPDPHSSDGTTGERIEPVQGGWHLLNHAAYREIQTPAQAAAAQRAAAYRDRIKRDASRSSQVVTSRNVTASGPSTLLSAASGVAGSGEGEREREEPAKPKRTKAPKPQPDPDLFDRFWDAYQKKVAKGAAWKAWQAKVGCDTELAERVIAAAQTFADLRETRKDNRKFQPHPATWLNAERWEDHIPGVTPEKPPEPQMSDFDYVDQTTAYRAGSRDDRLAMRQRYRDELAGAPEGLREFHRPWFVTLEGFFDQIDRETPK